MNNEDRFEQTMQEYFSERKTLPPEIRKRIHNKLVLENRKQNKKWLWFTMFGVVAFAIVAFLLMYVFSSSIIALCISAINIPICVCGSLLLVTVSGKEKSGGDCDAVLD